MWFNFAHKSIFFGVFFLLFGYISYFLFIFFFSYTSIFFFTFRSHILYLFSIYIYIFNKGTPEIKCSSSTPRRTQFKLIYKLVLFFMVHYYEPITSETSLFATTDQFLSYNPTPVSLNVRETLRPITLPMRSYRIHLHRYD